MQLNQKKRYKFTMQQQKKKFILIQSSLPSSFRQYLGK